MAKKKVDVDMEAKLAMLEILWAERNERIKREEEAAKKLASIHEAFKNPIKSRIIETNELKNMEKK